MSESRETILIVDDEEPVKRTVRDWLAEARLGVDILSASDAETALSLANQHRIDLAILDWNLGAGHHGLQLLEDLYLFNSDVVAILMTGYAQQATPLDAMRMGVRDYLDKNQNFNRDSFLEAVRKQLARIRPARRERLLHQRLVAFREAVQKIIPLVQAAAALNDPLSPPEAIAALVRFLVRATQAREGILLVRSYDAGRTPAEQFVAYDASGSPLPPPGLPFARSLAGAISSAGEAMILNPTADSSGTEWQDFERGRSSLLAAPLPAGAGQQVVLELFDCQRTGGFSPEDRRLVASAAEFGGEMLRQALAGRQGHRSLLDALSAALGAGDCLSQTLDGSPAQRMQEPPPPDVLQTLKQELGGEAMPADESLQLAEAIRVLALRHGLPAVRHCLRMIEELRRLLDAVSSGEAAS